MKYTEEEIKTAKKVLDIVNAILNNKTIQYKSSSTCNEWVDVIGIPIFNEKNIDNFRVKPLEAYRPCTCRKEFIEVLAKDWYNIELSKRNADTFDQIIGICENGVQLRLGGAITYQKLFEEYIFRGRIENTRIIGVKQEIKQNLNYKRINNNFTNFITNHIVVNRVNN